MTEISLCHKTDQEAIKIVGDLFWWWIMQNKRNWFSLPAHLMNVRTFPLRTQISANLEDLQSWTNPAPYRMRTYTYYPTMQQLVGFIRIVLGHRDISSSTDNLQSFYHWNPLAFLLWAAQTWQRSVLWSNLRIFVLDHIFWKTAKKKTHFFLKLSDSAISEIVRATDTYCRNRNLQWRFLKKSTWILYDYCHLLFLTSRISGRWRKKKICIWNNK